MSTCEKHDTPYAWVQVAPGKSTYACPACLAGERDQRKHDRLEVPRIKYCESWHRDRPYTQAEKMAPFQTRKRGWGT